MENKNRLSYDILATDDMTDEEFQRAMDEFFEKYPECTRDPHIEVLDLVIKRETAEKILSGEKMVVYTHIFSPRHSTSKLASARMAYRKWSFFDEHFLGHTYNLFHAKLYGGKRLHFWKLIILPRITPLFHHPNSL